MEAACQESPRLEAVTPEPAPEDSWSLNELPAAAWTRAESCFLWPVAGHLGLAGGRPEPSGVTERTPGGWAPLGHSD